MVKGINLAIQELQEGITNEINKSRLPIGVTLIALKNYVSQLESINAVTVENERKAFEEEKEKEGATDGEEICKA